MRHAKATLALLSLCLLAAALLPSAAAAAAPGWSLTVTPSPANFAPGEGGEYVAVATNVGGAVTDGTVATLELTVPAGLVIEKVIPQNSDPRAAVEPECTTSAQTVTCGTTEPVNPGRWLLLQVNVSVPALTPSGTLEAKATASGGGAAKAALSGAPTPVQDVAVPFGILAGFVAPATSEEGTPETQVGSHPFQQTVSFGFPTKNPGDGLTNDGHPRDVYIELPRGMTGNPAATPVLCTEAELTSSEGCPEESQVGVTDVTSLIGEVGNDVILSSNLYNMVPAPGSAAEIATDVATAGIYVHILGGVRSESDFGVEAAVRDSIAFGQQPIFNLQGQIWGDPSSAAHELIREECRDSVNTCPVDQQKTAFLTMPGECPGAPMRFGLSANSWEEPNPPFKEAHYESADSEGTPTTLQGCDTLDFKPTIEVRPTTNLIDSPSGLDFTLRQPQNTSLEGRSPSPLRDLTVHFPAGMAVNPSQAAGLGACSEAQIGLIGAEEGSPRFSRAPQSCPDAAKIGTVTATSPLLVARNAAHKVEKGPAPAEEPVLEALHGSLYIARPFANPFGSLIAVYLAIEDPKTGIVAKLAGKGELDPQTGQITTRFTRNPELPLQEAAVHIFGGPRGALITPPTCAQATTTSELTPWSAPEGKDAAPTDSFQMSRTPLGGSCPASEAQMPNAPKLLAGTAAPSAGKYSPLLFKLSREDGTQRLGRLEATLPTGLSAKLAGVGECSEADIARARSREAPEKGALEQADPSCPATSQLGTVTAAAGAGPTPYYTQGHAYLAGPYKGAPISMVAIVPAVAGPFDLGAVVVRAAIYLDPTTAQGRVVSDPLPAILNGVPVDARSVAVRAERPNFSLNPTSCDPKSFAGTVTSTLGLGAPISERFQVGGCKSLPYKPKLHLRLFGPTHRGGHPRFRAIFEAKAGEANTARASLTLPHSEFIDQAHFRTICTRVQYAANQCPPGSIYGHVKAISPLLGYPLEGPIYLRSSRHELPDVVAALRGPAFQPVALDLVGRVDSVNGGLRTRLETVPDAPVRKAIITLRGAKKGLFQNSTNICRGTFRASLELEGQNGKVADTKPVVKADCKQKPKQGAKGGKGKGGGH
jgi:hypothetical protein